MELTASRAQGWKTRFFTIWAGQALSLLGSELAGFALIWWLTRATGSATVLATLTLMAIVPRIFLGPFAGALVDRLNRRRVMIAADGLIALASLGLAILYAVDAVQPWHIFAIILIRAFGGTFHGPAMTASTTLMVPKAQLARVAGANQTLTGIIQIVSPALGALLISILPFYAVVGIDVGTALLAIVPLLFIAIPQPECMSGSVASTFLQDLSEGFRYAFGWTGLVLVGVMATLLNMLLSPAFSLLPLLVTKHLGGEAWKLGTLQSALGIGIVLGGLTLSAWGGFRRRIHTSLVGVLGIGVSVFVVGVAPGLAVSTAFGVTLAGLFLAGLANPIANGPLIAVVQAGVAPEMQGRVLTLMDSVASALSLLGLAVAGPVADRFGLPAWFLAAGVMCVVMGVGAFFVPAIVRLEEGRQ